MEWPFHGKKGKRVTSQVLSRQDVSGKLPTPPGVVHRLLELTRKSDVSVREVADTISGDPALAAKILRFVNSPMSGVAREITSIQQGVALVGVRGVTTMALSLAVIGSGRGATCTGFDLDHFNMQSLACGAAAKNLAALTRAIPPQDAFSAGLFSQIGRSVFAVALPDEYAPVLSASRCAPRDLPPLETSAFGEAYPVLGAHLLRKWGLPESLCTAIEKFRDDPQTEGHPVLSRLINCAEIAATIICPPSASQPPDAHEFLVTMQRDFGVEQESAIRALGEMVEEIKELRHILEIPQGNVRAADVIESEVRERIAEMSIAMHMENQSMALQQADLLRRASTDALTGIGNRAAFDTRLDHEIERAIRSGAPLALLMIDVDKFKNFNDSHGHPAGDRVLQTVARVLDENIRKVDFVARYGGEEFAVIAPGTPMDGVLLLAERLRQSVQEATVPWDGKQLGVTISIGAAVFTELVDRRDAVTIIRAADAQLYRAKDAGRNQVKCAAAATPCGTVTK